MGSSSSESFFLVAEMDSATPMVVGRAARARRPKTIFCLFVGVDWLCWGGRGVGCWIVENVEFGCLRCGV